MWDTSKFTLITCLVAFASISKAVVVNIKYGAVRGQTIELNTGKRVNSFLAIPFAKPPIGSLRFEKPLEPEPWTEEFVANELGPACPQGGGLFGFTHPLWDYYSEGCLHLNVFAPNDTSNGPYAVMIWFHGGGYGGSANIQYPGHFLAARDVVVVVPNYRLGVLGFASTEDKTIPGNMGMYDQVLALKFIRDNIRAFGGDPKRVTAFGQSAGGSSAGLHLMSPLSKNLVHQIIGESGNEMAAWAYSDPDMHQEDYTNDVARGVNCTTETPKAMIDCLRTKNASDLIKIGPDLKLGWITQGFAPVVDGADGFLPDRPETLRKEGKYNKQSRVISGHTTEDGSLYVLGLVPEASEGGLNRSQFLEIMRRNVEYLGVDFDPYKVEQAYQAVVFQYSNWPHINDLEANRQKMNEIFTDVGFGVTMDMMLRSHTEVNTTYMYILGFRSSNATELVPEWMGVPHNGELPYVWGWPLLQLNPAVRDDCQIYFDIIDWNQEDIDYANYIETLWTNFAKTGNPTPTPVDSPNGNGPTTWKQFTKDNYNYLYINRLIEDRENYRQKNFAFFREYLPWIVTHEPPTPSPPIPADKSKIMGHLLRKRTDEVLQTNHKIAKEKATQEKINRLKKKMFKRQNTYRKQK